MKKFIKYISIAIGTLLLIPTIVLAAPSSTISRSVLPEATNSYDLGTTSRVWNRIIGRFASTSVLTISGASYFGDDINFTGTNQIIRGLVDPGPFGSNHGGDIDIVTGGSPLNNRTGNLNLRSENGSGGAAGIINILGGNGGGSTGGRIFIQGGMAGSNGHTAPGEVYINGGYDSLFQNFIPAGNIYLNASTSGYIAIATTSPGTILSIGTSTGFINFSNYSTSTMSKGINILGGCFAVNGVCIGNASGSGTVTSVATNNGLTGGTITTTGTLGLNTAGFSTRALLTWDGSNLVATGTPQLTVGNINATSTTATSTFASAITVGAGQGTSTFANGISTNQINLTSGTSTGAKGFNLTGGCFAINGACILGTSGTGIITNVGSIQSTLSTTSLPINIKDYGAVGNGSTDDTTAIQNAINVATSTGRPIYAPTGNYKITNELVYHSSNNVSSGGIVFYGDGYRNTLITQATANKNAFHVDSASGLNGLEWKQLELVGPGMSSTNGTGILIDTSTGATDNGKLEDVYISGFRQGFRGTDIDSFVFERFSLINNTTHFWVDGNSNNNTIVSSGFVSAGATGSSTGMRIDSGRGWKVSGLDIGGLDMSTSTMLRGGVGLIEGANFEQYGTSTAVDISNTGGQIWEIKNSVFVCVDNGVGKCGYAIVKGSNQLLLDGNTMSNGRNTGVIKQLSTIDSGLTCLNQTGINGQIDVYNAGAIFAMNHCTVFSAISQNDGDSATASTTGTFKIRYSQGSGDDALNWFHQSNGASTYSLDNLNQYNTDVRAVAVAKPSVTSDWSVIQRSSDVWYFNSGSYPRNTLIFNSNNTYCGDIQMLGLGRWALGYDGTCTTTAGTPVLTWTSGAPGDSSLAASVGISSTSPGTRLSIGNTGNNTINISETSTSTFGTGINIRTGCFAINTVCLGGLDLSASNLWASTASTTFTATTTFVKAVITPEFQIATSSTTNINWGNGSKQLLRIGNGNMTVTWSNFVPGQSLNLKVCNPNTGTAGTITWPSTILWPGGVQPGQTTVAQKCDLWGYEDTNGTSTEKQMLTGLSSSY